MIYVLSSQVRTPPQNMLFAGIDHFTDSVNDGGCIKIVQTLIAHATL